jgi:hypothetical protein
MLNGKLALHDVADCEALCERALTDELRHTGTTHLTTDDREDLLQHLLGLAWELSLRYDPERGWSFSKYAYHFCRLRGVPDWYRQRFPGTRFHGAQTILSLEGPGADSQHRLGDSIPIHDRLPTPDRDPDGIPWTLTNRRMFRASDVALIRAASIEQAA